jgi:hypothetical protein
MRYKIQFKPFLKIVIFATAFISRLFHPLLISQASSINSSLGITGSFANYQFVMVPDETLSHPDVFVRFFNNYSVDIEIHLFSETPDHVTINLEEEIYLIPALQNIMFPVEITTTSVVTPGDYRIFFGATIVETIVEGINVTGTARLGANLSILGEAANLDITTITPKGNPIPAQLDLFRLGENTGPALPVRQSLDGTLNARLAVGNYVIEATYDDYLVARETFTLVHLEEKVIVLVANLIQVTSFTVVPQFYESEDDSETLGSMQATYSITTLFESLENIRIYMVVSLDGTLLEKTLIAQLFLLSEGSFMFYQNFVPTNGWSEGVYTFSLASYQVGESNTEFLFGESQEDSVSVTLENLPNPPTDIIEVIPWWLIALLLIATIAIVEIALLIQKRSFKVKSVAVSSLQPLATAKPSNHICERDHQYLLQTVLQFQNAKQTKNAHDIQITRQQLEVAIASFVRCFQEQILSKTDQALLQQAKS